jgi:Replication initiator protein A
MTDRKPLTASPILEGRDEMNLADFPISVLESHQPTRIDGGKVDTVVYEASRYDAVTKRRMPQRVTLLTNSQIGLPTPTDENVVLGLLCLAKQASNFESPRVHFTPHALISVLRWAPTGKNYQRLRDSLRHLKALTIRYENAWWDKDGREYQSEFSTGIIAEYFLATQIRGRRKADAVPENFVVFSPRFYESLQKGNLKRLDLNTLFSLKLPTSQRMYRFLDKRFYGSHSFEMDLVEFACGHIGMTPTKNVAHLKQRLEPPIEELEGIGFLAKSDRSERYVNHAPKVWRLQLNKGNQLERPEAQPDAKSAPLVPAVPKRQTTATELVQDFYRERFHQTDAVPLWKELILAEELLVKHGSRADQVVRMAVRLLRQFWPDGKTFLAIVRYLPEAEKLAKRDRSRVPDPLRESLEQAERVERAETAKEQAILLLEWNTLTVEVQEQIRDKVLAAQPTPLRNHPKLIEKFCLLELQKRRKDQ